jgi:hypothetical protein
MVRYLKGKLLQLRCLQQYRASTFKKKVTVLTDIVSRVLYTQTNAILGGKKKATETSYPSFFSSITNLIPQPNISILWRFATESHKG